MAQLPTYEEYMASNRDQRGHIRNQYKAAGIAPPHASFGRVHKYKDSHYPEDHAMHADRPYRWHFEDPILREQHFAYNKAKAQARFRKEEWELSLEDYFDAWAGSWHLRGRASHNMVMTRRDPERAWSPANVEIIPRYESICRIAEQRRGQPTKCR
jgi:hypothetical protein